MTRYRLSWEMVSPHKMAPYCNADPVFYSNTTQLVPNSQIPDEDWHEVSKETEDPWDQYKTLKQWASEDREFVRNVRLEEQASEPQWREVSSD